MCQWLQLTPFSLSLPIQNCQSQKLWVIGIIQKDITSLCSNPESIGTMKLERLSLKIELPFSKRGESVPVILQSAFPMWIGNLKNGIPILLTYRMTLEMWLVGHT